MLECFIILKDYEPCIIVRRTLKHFLKVPVWMVMVVFKTHSATEFRITIISEILAPGVNFFRPTPLNSVMGYNISLHGTDGYSETLYKSDIMH